MRYKQIVPPKKYRVYRQQAPTSLMENLGVVEACHKWEVFQAIIDVTGKTLDEVNRQFNISRIATNPRDDSECEL